MILYFIVVISFSGHVNMKLMQLHNYTEKVVMRLNHYII